MAESAQAPGSTATADEIADVISQLEQYRARLVDDFTATAKKAKLPKSMVMAQIKTHPEIVKIDTSLWCGEPAAMRSPILAIPHRYRG